MKPFLYKESNQYWYVYYFKNNKRTKISTKSKNVNVASRYFSDFMIKYNNGFYNVKTISLKEFEYFIVNYFSGNRAFKTMERYKFIVRRMIKHFGPEFKLSDFSLINLGSFLKDLLSTLQVSTVKEYQVKISYLFKIARQFGFLSQIISLSFLKLSVPQRMPVYFSKEDFLKFISFIKEIDFKELCIFAFMSGMRKSEIISLKWCNVDFNKSLVILDNHSFVTKTSKVRSVPLNNVLIDLLKRRFFECKSKNVFYYHTKTNRVLLFKDFTVNRLMKIYIRKSYLNNNLVFHSLRHGFASELVRQGVNIFNVQQLLGHSNIKTTMIYSHLEPESLRKDVQVLNLN